VTLTLRPHHLLCRLGFVGYGYSPAFIQEMERLARAFESKRVQRVILKSGFDHICRACPHQGGECSPQHLGHRGLSANELDRRALRALKLKLGHPYPVPEIEERIAALDEEDFRMICIGCEWQALGACRDGYLRLRQRHAPRKR